MSFENLNLLFTFVGGLGMFLYGMDVMAEGLQKAAGSKMKQLMAYLTDNRLMGVLVGVVVTGIIQSSSATTVMVVGFVNAGIMNLLQATGVIMGANIGTTVTSWLVSMNEWGSVLKYMKPDFFAPLFIGVGAFVMLLSKNQKKRQIAQIGVGFGVLFVGLSFMTNAIEPFSDAPVFINAFQVLGKNPLLGILAGAVVTAIIQSSSASVGILQTLASTGVVSWSSAIFVTLGQNIGTCITAILSSAGANKTAKRAAVIHLLFNVIGAVIFGIIMFIVFTVSKDFASSNISSTQISIFHTIFNVTNTILLFSFANGLVKLSGLIIKGDDEVEEDEEQIALRHLDERILETPSFAVENAILEVIRMGNITLQNIKASVAAVIEKDKEKIQFVMQEEKTIDKLEALITEYLIKINNLPLTEEQHLVVNDLFYTIGDIERVGDHAENIVEFANFMIDNNLKFSDEAKDELMQMSEAVINGFEKAIEARALEDIDFVRKVNQLEDLVDDQKEEYRELHIARLANNVCDTQSGIIFLDMISNLERISDHSYNIANYVKDELA